MVTVTYRYQFNYRQLESGPFPLLQFRVSNPDNSELGLDVDAYVDSGAEGSIFGGHIISALGLELLNDRPKDYAPTFGGSLRGYLHRVLFSHPQLGTFNLEIGFSAEPIKRNLLGRDFFNYVQIGFRERQLEYYINPIP